MFALIGLIALIWRLVFQAQVLEPLLWRRFTHQQAAGGALESEEIDLDLAANEGIMIMGLDFIIPTQYTTGPFDMESAVIARPSAEDTITNMPEAVSDSDFIAGMHIQATQLVEGGLNQPHERDWRPPGAEGENGLVIARRMTYLQDTSATGVIMALTAWYKRLIFTDSEMIGLLIRRR